MKLILLSAITSFLLTGCGNKNAFTALNLTPQQEKAIEYTKSDKLVSGDNVGGFFSAVYLNNILSDIDENTQEFYISVYLKNGYQNLQFSLSGQKATEIQELDETNKFTSFLTSQNEWSKNYHIVFSNINNNDLNLSIYTDQFSSGQLMFPKE